MASVYKEATPTPASYDPLVKAVQQLSRTVGAVSAVQHLSDEDKAFVTEQLVPALAESNRLLASVVARVDRYTAGVNLNLALVAIVVTALTIGLSINMTLKDGQL